MSNIPAELRYTTSHEWVRHDGDNLYTVGITEHAQELLGDMVFVELPDVGDEINAGDDVAVAESVKAASDVYSPLTGEVVAVNEELDGEPERVNNDAFGDGWMFQVKIEDPSEVENLLSAEDYADNIDDE